MHNHGLLIRVCLGLHTPTATLTPEQVPKLDLDWARARERTKHGEHGRGSWSVAKPSHAAAAAAEDGGDDSEAEGEDGVGDGGQDDANGAAEGAAIGRAACA